jgi:hypothetical protein
MLPFSKVGPIKLRQLANRYSNIILKISLQRIIVKGYAFVVILGLSLRLGLECSLGNSCVIVLIIPISILTR